MSTVQIADVIAAIQEGVVVEKGSHDELLQTDGVYHQLVTLQVTQRFTTCKQNTVTLLEIYWFIILMVFCNYPLQTAHYIYKEQINRCKALASILLTRL